MPLPIYRRPWFLFNEHFETIWPSLFRILRSPGYRRETIPTPDDDFLDIDWLESGCNRLSIISHGLEGNSYRHYVVGMAATFAEHGWDALAWNFRGCGGQINRQPRFTHNGASEDLNTVVRHALTVRNYQTVVLVGFSMGGNLSLVYLGREAAKIPSAIKAAVCFSVPCDLAASAQKMAALSNTIYMRRFTRLMGQKVKRLSQDFPEEFPIHDYHLIKSFFDFDQRYTAPLHGFRNAEHYWQESNCLRFLGTIRCPVWIINAQNDPFLSPSCFPRFSQHGNPLVHLITPMYGGHCGFTSTNLKGRYWSEITAVSLLSGLC